MEDRMHGPTRADAPTVAIALDTLRVLIEGAEYMAAMSCAHERGGRCAAYLHHAANRARAARGPDMLAPIDNRG